MDCHAIREQIDRILRSECFADKVQLRTLLQVLFRNMETQTTLKPDRVIRELWPKEARTKRSADVATEMNRLRRALECYYNSEGQADPIAIRLPNRSLPGPDGLREKRWIVAEARSGNETATPEAEALPEPDQAPAALEPAAPADPPAPAPPPDSILPAKNPRTGLKIAVAAVLLVLAAFYTFRELSADRHPQSGRLDGETLTVMNEKGKVLWHKNFPGGFSRDFYEQGLATRLWFGDLDGDGRTSVLLLYHPANGPKSHSTAVICYSESGKERWRWMPGRALPELNGSPAFFEASGLGVLKATPTQPRRIVVVSHHELYYPSQIAILDTHGKTLSEYWHSGNLYTLALASLNDSGHELIVASGISNGYHQATMVVLDPDHASGASTEAARPELQIHGMGVAHERLRVLFPRSDLNQNLCVYNVGLQPVVDRGRVRLSVRECFLRPGGCFIWYEFDKDFQLVSAVADDEFRAAHKEFYLTHKTDHPFDAVEEAQFQKVRCLAGCKTEFVPVAIP